MSDSSKYVKIHMSDKSKCTSNVHSKCVQLIVVDYITIKLYKYKSILRSEVKLNSSSKQGSIQNDSCFFIATVVTRRHCSDIVKVLRKK